MIGNLNVSAVAGQSHDAFDSNLLLRVERVGSSKAEGVSLVLNAVSVRVVVSVCVLDKGAAGKKVKAGCLVGANSVSVNVVDQVGKVHRHCVERLNFVADIDVAQFNQGAQRAALYNGLVAGVGPHDARISVIVNDGLNVKLAGDSALDQNVAVNVNHKLVRVALVACDVGDF